MEAEHGLRSNLLFNPELYIALAENLQHTLGPANPLPAKSALEPKFCSAKEQTSFAQLTKNMRSTATEI